MVKAWGSRPRFGMRLAEGVAEVERKSAAIRRSEATSHRFSRAQKDIADCVGAFYFLVVTVTCEGSWHLVFRGWRC